MAEILDESNQLESTTVGVYRTAATIKGGRRFSFSSMVVVGDRRGNVGLGYGKANQVPPAIEKAQKEGRKSMKKVTLKGGTIPHEVTGRFAASSVRLIPAAPGTGVVAGASVRAVLEMAGVTDCLTKCFGSTNQQNVVKATFDGLQQLTTREEIASLRKIEIEPTIVDEMLERGKAFMPQARFKRQKQDPAADAKADDKGKADAKPEPKQEAKTDANPEADAAKKND